MKKELLRSLPSLDSLLNEKELKDALNVCSRSIIAGAARAVLEEVRESIKSGKRAVKAGNGELVSKILERAGTLLGPSVKRVINATGTILHTNLGRAVLPKEAVEAVRLAAEGNINLEFDLSTGERGERDSLVEGLLKRLTGAEAACVVNNNAAAVLLTLNTLAEGREVIISRGELIEIGGSFRLPEIIRKSGCVLREVGTTNRTHPKDYGGAINGSTALILKAHTSNYRVVGFTAEVGLQELARIGRENNIPVVEDLGSGSLLDLTPFGLPKEPVVRESLEAGAEIVTFSGDKLLGGPQAGIIAGKKVLVDRVRKNPLKRALRADKLTLSALEATLRLYLDEGRLRESIPTLRYLTRDMNEISELAEKAAFLLSERLGPDYTVTVVESESVAGGGSLPGHSIPTKAVAVSSPVRKAGEIATLFLENDPPIIGRVKKDLFLLDMRTIDSAEDVALK